MIFPFVSIRGEVVVLDNNSFSVQPGERVAIVGASGAGKSTIKNTLVARPNYLNVLEFSRHWCSFNQKSKYHFPQGFFFWWNYYENSI